MTTSVAKNQPPQEPVTLSKKEAETITVWTEEVEPEWKLNIVPEGGIMQVLDIPFTISVYAINIEDGTIDNDAFFDLTEFIGDLDALEFSSDNGETWKREGIPLQLANGQASILAHITSEAKVNVTVKAENASTGILTITSQRAKEKKKLELNYEDPEGGGEEKLILEFEEK